MMLLPHLPSQWKFVQFFTKELSCFHMQRQIQKLSIFKTSDLLNKLTVYQNLYSVSRVTAVTTGKHTYFHMHDLNRTYNNQRHRIKFIPTLLQPAGMTECASELPLHPSHSHLAVKKFPIF